MRMKAANVQLSEKEALICVLICEGLNNAEIAKKLKMGENTVSAHVAKMFRALEISSRAQLVFWCVQHPRALLLREWDDYRLHRVGCDCLTLPYCGFVRAQTLPQHAPVKASGPPLDLLDDLAVAQTGRRFAKLPRVQQEQIRLIAGRVVIAEAPTV